MSSSHCSILEIFYSILRTGKGVNVTGVLPKSRASGILQVNHLEILRMRLNFLRCSIASSCTTKRLRGTPFAADNTGSLANEALESELHAVRVRVYRAAVSSRDWCAGSGTDSNQLDVQMESFQESGKSFSIWTGTEGVVRLIWIFFVFILVRA